MTSVFAVSPDGRRLAFAAAGQDGVLRLWVRALDSLDARPLPGTELGNLPPPFFWSPDSRFIVLDAGGKLKKIDVTGGVPQTLCDLEGVAIGGSWNREGVIIIGNSSGPLLRVSADGGAPTPVTALDPARKEALHALPTFLEDQRHFLYLRGSSAPENSGIYVGSLDSKPQEQSARKLLPPPGVVHVPGRLLFLRGTTLLTQEFDERRIELKGEPVAVADAVGIFLGFPFVSASTNGVLVYRGAGGENLQLTWLDRQGKVLGKAGEPGHYHGLALSPDGTRVVMSRRHPQGPTTWDLWLLDLSRGTNTRLTFGPARPDYPVWSPDGTRIAYTAVGGGPGNLYQKLVDGSKAEEILLKSSEPQVPTSWSRDGRFVLLTATAPQTATDVWVLPVKADAKPIRILGTTFSEGEAQFSPDMRWIAYASNESGKYEIYVRGFNASAPESSDAGAKWLVSQTGGTQPRWRGDGKELFYIAPDGKLMSAEIAPGPAFRAGIPKALFQLPQGFGSGDIAADGKRLLFAVPVEQSAQVPFTAVVNWTSALRK